MIITLKLEIGDAPSKSKLFIRLGEIADALENVGIEILDYTEQKDATGAPAPKPARKPRGPNKRRGGETIVVHPNEPVKIVAGEGTQHIEGVPDHSTDTNEIPGFLKRTA